MLKILYMWRQIKKRPPKLVRQPFDEIKHRHTLKEVGDIAEGAYDWKLTVYKKKVF